MLASQNEEVLAVAVTVALTAGPYNGSTFSVAGRVGVYDDKAEAAVVGGTSRLPDVEDGRAGGVREVRDGGAGRAHVRAAGERRRWQLVVISAVAVD